VQIIKEKYFKELENSKDQIIEQINKSSTTIPSEALQNELKHIKEEFEKFRVESKQKIESLNAQHQTNIDKLKENFEAHKVEMINKHETEVKQIRQTDEKKVNSLITEYDERNSKLNERIFQMESQLNQEKNNLSLANDKIEGLNTLIGRHQNKEEMFTKSIDDKDKEILDLKNQITELINSVKTIKNQSDDEIRLKLLSLENEVKEYKERLLNQEQRHADILSQAEQRHIIEIKTLKDSQTSYSSIDQTQRDNFAKLLQEKDSILKNTKENYDSMINTKEEMIQKLQSKIAKLKREQETKTKEIYDAQQEQRKLIERIREEMQSVLSLKSAFSDEDQIASKDELNENMRIINEFFNNPYDNTLKKIFKLKRVRKEDNSVDSCELMRQNHHDETEEHEIE